MTKNSTDYYRENKKQRRVVHSCPHCNFETTYGKCVLINHINAHHTEECNRPFQCSCCNRGFAQKAHLVAHLKKVHNVIDPNLEKKNGAILYFITPTELIPKSYNTKARRDFYNNHPKLNSRDIKNGIHTYMTKNDNSACLRNHDIHYDQKKGFINLKKIQLKEPIRVQKKYQTPTLIRNSSK